jgi:hypothetical protein
MQIIRMFVNTIPATHIAIPAWPCILPLRIMLGVYRAIITPETDDTEMALITLRAWNVFTALTNRDSFASLQAQGLDVDVRKEISLLCDNINII